MIIAFKIQMLVGNKLKISEATFFQQKIAIKLGNFQRLQLFSTQILAFGKVLGKVVVVVLYDKLLQEV